jgi:hypothetical protein
LQKFLVMGEMKYAGAKRSLQSLFYVFGALPDQG